MTRVFAYNSARNLFYYLEANFTTPRPTDGRRITLYTVDPITGSTVVSIVSGATDFPSGTEITRVSDRLGYAFDDTTGKIIMATTVGDPSGQGPPPTGFRFYILDPSTGVAQLISSAPV